MNNLPVIPTNYLSNLIEYLDYLYPDRAPNNGDSIEDIRFYSGQVSVVRKLKQLKKDFEEQSL